MTRLTREEFEAWRASPLTELILGRFIADEMAATKARHDAQAWEGPLAPETHTAYRERYETLEFMNTLDFETVEAWLTTESESDDD